MHKRKHTTFFCFSPPVMIATFAIEIALAAYALWRYRRTPLVWIAVSLLFFLALFQLAEFQVCTGSSGLKQWSHLGYAAITLLPPLAIHALAILKGKASHPIVYASYVSGIAFMAYFLLATSSLNGHVCQGNYVIFHVNPGVTWLYAVYYYGWTVIAMILAAIWGKQAKQMKLRQAFYGISTGFVMILAPTTTANLVNDATKSGIPSIMCGFAVLFALILGLYVLPRAAKRR